MSGFASLARALPRGGGGRAGPPPEPAVRGRRSAPTATAWTASPSRWWWARCSASAGSAVSTAESCTGGLVAHRLTNIPGSSRYVERGVVVYSNEAKTDLLGVPAELIRAHGAVSAPVAEAMARGACRIGGTACGMRRHRHRGTRRRLAGKPVGTVFIGVASPGGRRGPPLPLRGRARGGEVAVGPGRARHCSAARSWR